MGLKKGKLFFTFITIALFSIMSFAMDTKQLEHDYMQITQLREAKDIVGLENLIRNNNGKWSQLDIEAYGSLMVHALKSWNSIYNENDENESANQMREYANQVLSTYNKNRSKNISIEAEFSLVSILYEKYTYSKGRRTDHEWSNDRRKGAEAFLHVWQRIEDALDEDYGPTDLPVENVDIPEGVVGFPGMLPERVDDPNLRVEYEKAIRANEKKIDIYNKLIRLQNNKKMYFRVVKNYLVSTYSIAPYDNRELQDLVETYVKDRDTRKQFMEDIIEIYQP